MPYPLMSAARASNREISELIFEFRVPTHPYNAPNLPGFDGTRRT